MVVHVTPFKGPCLCFGYGMKLGPQKEKSYVRIQLELTVILFVQDVILFAQDATRTYDVQNQLNVRMDLIDVFAVQLFMYAYCIFILYTTSFFTVSLYFILLAQGVKSNGGIVISEKCFQSYFNLFQRGKMDFCSQIYVFLKSRSRHRCSLPILRLDKDDKQLELEEKFGDKITVRPIFRGYPLF